VPSSDDREEVEGKARFFRAFSCPNMFLTGVCCTGLSMEHS